jgi:hypothetical protein
MRPTSDIHTIFPRQDLPPEMTRRSSVHQGESADIASVLSGLTSSPQVDEVISPSLIKRNLVIPARHGFIDRESWRVR